ncbi:hypothetical protein M4D81_32875 [Paenibacillus sp. p3-SID867]|uniref:hypothetical protein n=1 Tax=Paenibacillus sp. p3-SID867 TaxID=2916363 RepID=UPI0021A7B5AC|nr:hypothetical protein [Paenibacillus sp. p3-SID867]MCT1403802.1 hypothetical protein [Paenibacillus sp. p3-SID867]
MIEHPGKQENGADVRVFSVSSGNVVFATLEGNGTFLGQCRERAKSPCDWALESTGTRRMTATGHGTPKQLDSPGLAVFDDIRGLWFRYSFVFCPLMEV